MSKLTFKNKHNFAKSAFKKVSTFFIGTALAIGIFSAVDGDGYLFLLQHNTSAGSLILQIMQTVSKTLGISNNTSNESVGEKGLNELLVQKMQAGIAKDYLSICLENEEGKLDTTKRKAYIPVNAIVVKNAVEHGYTDIKKATNTIPKTDIPGSLVDSGKYGTGNITLYKWNSQTRSNGATGIGGPFAFTSDNITWTGLDTKSVYNTGTHTPNGKGDGYLFPDAVASFNSYAVSAFDDIGVAKKTMKANQNYLDILSLGACINHNCGKGWYDEMLYGVCWNVRSKIGSKDNDETLKRANTVVSDINDVKNDLSSKQLKAIGTDKGAWVSDLIMIKAGWTITPTCRDWLLQYSTNTVKTWNILFPNDKASASTIKGKLNKHTADVTELTGYSATECDKLFGTTGGKYICPGYTTGSKTKYGTLLKILDGSSSGLKTGNKSTKRVIALNALGAQSGILAVALGNNYVKKMLLYAGVDPKDITGAVTGASTETMTSGNVSFETKSDVIDDLKAHGCDTGKLNAGRYAVLVAARKMQGSEYVWGAGHDGCNSTKHSGYDCSGYVAHAIRASGIDKVSSFNWVPGTSGDWGGSDNSHIARKSFSSLGYSGLLPADIIWHSGHVFIWVGSKGGHQWTLQAEGRNGNTDSAGLPMKINGWHGYDNKSSYVTVNRLKGYYAPTDHF